MLDFVIAFIIICFFCTVIRSYVNMMDTTSAVDLKKSKKMHQQLLISGKQNENSAKKKPAPNSILSRKMAGSNWQNAAESVSQQVKSKKDHKLFTKYVALDCEMVGVGSNGQDDMLARVSIVNQHGDVLIDKYVKPREKVIDYRTRVSGIRPKDIENGVDFERVQNEVINILHDKILVGHAINNDLGVLFIKHPSKYIRDTAKYRPLAKLVANGATPSLKRLSKAILGVDIQGGEHNSVEDARAAMAIYNKFSNDWEKYIKRSLQQYHRSNKGGRGR